MGQHKWVFIGICYSVILIRRKIYIYNEIHGHYQFSWLLIYLSAGAIHLLWTAVLRVWYLCAQEQYIPKLVVFGMANILSARANINEKFLKNSSFQHSNTLMGITISSDLVQKQILGRIQKREVFLNPSLQDFGYFVVSFWCLLAFINGINTVSLFTAHSTCIQNQHCSKQTCMQFEMLGCWNWELPSSFVTQQSHLFETVKMIQMMQNLYNVSGNWLIREEPTELLQLLHLNLVQPDHPSCTDKASRHSSTCAVGKLELRNISLWMISMQERGHFHVDLGANLRGACWSYSPSVRHSVSGSERFCQQVRRNLCIQPLQSPSYNWNLCVLQTL